MPDLQSKIATICDCIDHSMSFYLWCHDFASHLGEDVIHVGVAFDVISDATRLQSFIALRKLDDFLGSINPQPDDLTAISIGINPVDVLDTGRATFLLQADRKSISKGAAHLTESLTLDPDTEVDLDRIISESVPTFQKLLLNFKKLDVADEASHWIARTESLLDRFSNKS